MIYFSSFSNKLSCDYKSEEFLSWASDRTIKVTGSICEIATTTVKILEKMIMYDSQNTVSQTEDLSVDFDSECSCSTCDSKYEKLSENSLTEITKSNKNHPLNLFLFLTFISGLVVGIAVTIFFWICYRVYRVRERHHLCYKSMNSDDPLPLYEHLYNN